MNTTGWSNTAWAAAIAVGLAFSATGCELPPLPVTEEDDEPRPVAVDEDFELDGNPDDGASFYRTHCASCHGADGEGDGPSGQGLEPPPTDFTTVDLDPARAYIATRDGGQAVGVSRAMPAFRQAADEQQLRDVVAYIIAFGDDAPDDESEQTDENDPSDDESDQAEAIE